MPKVLVSILSLLPVPSRPQTIIELLGIAGSGIVTLPNPGTIVALISKVKTPEDETLNWSTILLLKLNEKGILSIADQTGEELPAGNITSHNVSRPEPKGYSLSIFNPPGFPVDELGV
jgi:hypothetical protein|tara:strand:- start:2131 stop:2484 length:354 start_codon:yes stop_codon:yes gene_type:complete